MKSLTTPDFWHSYAELSSEMKDQARKAYRLWRDNPFYPSLHFKKVGDGLWSARISGGYRALALKKGENYYWIWIGSHDNYEKLID
ncbi:hypothetical protein DP113_29655 [Brasilonema octagenarum UFV-E1]|uniref:ParE-like toxin domain-containing protein n=2 Tax=Brasilonema TaxID=383614 RepID=A0A856MLR2_9CYAN|nr:MULTISPECIES: hypothetical protein [Brasilonema]NMF61348.1 hypothetical protein [Brasilonema octagenarum UFV-OR1]QDL11482.1 hypothetical protein DP114_29495 [Brasilonema sennae CENA114]QDL17865.1 hypothetical protein DP113_29655 [Brasilonema octagenarum UFV-E1]